MVQAEVVAEVVVVAVVVEAVVVAQFQVIEKHDRDLQFRVNEKPDHHLLFRVNEKHDQELELQVAQVLEILHINISLFPMCDIYSLTLYYITK